MMRRKKMPLDLRANRRKFKKPEREYVLRSEPEGAISRYGRKAVDTLFPKDPDSGVRRLQDPANLLIRGANVALPHLLPGGRSYVPDVTSPDPTSNFRNFLEESKAAMNIKRSIRTKAASVMGWSENQSFLVDGVMNSMIARRMKGEDPYSDPTLKHLGDKQKQLMFEYSSMWDGAKSDQMNELAIESALWPILGVAGKHIPTAYKASKAFGKSMYKKIEEPWTNIVVNPTRVGRDKLTKTLFTNEEPGNALTKTTSKLYRSIVSAGERGTMPNTPGRSLGNFRIRTQRGKEAARKAVAGMKNLDLPARMAAIQYINKGGFAQGGSGMKEIFDSLSKAGYPVAADMKQQVYNTIQTPLIEWGESAAKSLKPGEVEFYWESMKDQLNKLLLEPMYKGDTDAIFQEAANFPIFKDMMKMIGKDITPGAGMKQSQKVLDRIITGPTVPDKLKDMARTMYDATVDTHEGFVKSLLKAEKEILYGRLLRNSMAVSRVPKKGFVPAEWSGIYSKGLRSKPHPFKGMYVQRDVNDSLFDMMDIDKHAGDFFETWFMTPWKMGKVVLRPATHFRNLFSNMVLNDWGGLSFSRMDIYGKALRDVVGKKKGFLDFAKDVNIDTTFSISEMTPMLGMRHGSSIFKTMLNFYEQKALPMSKLYQMEEMWFKYAKYMHNTEKGMSHANAITDAVKWTFDYGATTPFVRHMRRRWMPFATWQSKVIPLTIEAATHNPARFWKWPLVIAGMQHLAVKNTNITDAEWQNLKKDMPSYLQGGMHLLMPWRDDKKRLQLANLTYAFPGLGDMSEMQQQGIAYPIQHPLINLAGAVSNNKMFGGKPIWYDWESTGMKASKLLTYSARQMLPAITPVPGIGTDFDALYDTFWKDKEDALTPMQAAGGWMGVRINPMDPLKIKKRGRAISRLFKYQINTELRNELRDVTDLKERQKILKKHKKLLLKAKRHEF